MKKFIYAIIVLALASCASVKTSAPLTETPIGQWQCSITGTPEGDVEAILTIAQKDNTYTAVLTAQGSDLPFTDFSYIAATKKTVGSFYYSGTSVQLIADLQGDELTGAMEAGGAAFPFKGIRKN